MSADDVVAIQNLLAEYNHCIDGGEAEARAAIAAARRARAVCDLLLPAAQARREASGFCLDATLTWTAAVVDGAQPCRPVMHTVAVLL